MHVAKAKVGAEDLAERPHMDDNPGGILCRQGGPVAPLEQELAVLVVLVLVVTASPSPLGKSNSGKKERDHV